jgi:hypothetical protein
MEWGKRERLEIREERVVKRREERVGKSEG